MARVTDTSGVSRRAFLGLAVASVPIISACTADEETSPTTPPAPAPTTEAAQDALRSRVVAQETNLLARYDATVQAHPGLAPILTVIADQHREHRLALVSGEPPPSPESTPPPVPSDPSAAVTELIAAERTAADERTGACEEAADVELARLLALIAASEAGHAEALATTDQSAAS